MHAAGAVRIGRLRPYQLQPPRGIAGTAVRVMLLPVSRPADGNSVDLFNSMEMEVSATLRKARTRASRPGRWRPRRSELR